MLRSGNGDARSYDQNLKGVYYQHLDSSGLFGVCSVRDQPNFLICFELQIHTMADKVNTSLARLKLLAPDGEGPFYGRHDHDAGSGQ